MSFKCGNPFVECVGFKHREPFVLGVSISTSFKVTSSPWHDYCNQLSCFKPSLTRYRQLAIYDPELDALCNARKRFQSQPSATVEIDRVDCFDRTAHL